MLLQLIVFNTINVLYVFYFFVILYTIGIEYIICSSFIKNLNNYKD